MFKICLVGHFIERPDEGVRKVAYCLANELGRRHEVMTLSISAPLSGRKIRAFRPDVIHFVLCPTLSGLAIARCLSCFYPPAKTLVSAPQPAPLPVRKWMSLIKPDLVLIQSLDSEKMFQDLGYRTHFLPNGVDTGKFIPATDETKKKLRQKYGIPVDKFIILHVASLTRGRNLDILKKLQAENRNQVLIVGRVGERKNENLRHELEEAGCLVRTEYLPEIQDVYAFSDCYIFPTVDKRYCIETPLSVMEAMSCNLPVITTPFGALPRIFVEGDGFFFAHIEQDFFSALEVVKKGNMPVKTREKVLPYTWDNILKELEQIYAQLLA